MNTLSSTQRIADFLADIHAIAPDQYEMAVQIRDLHLAANPQASEQIKYGGLVFLIGGALRSGLFFYKAHLSLEFGQGAAMPDPHGVLEGAGKYRRHIKLRALADIKDKHVAHYIDYALHEGD